LIRSIDIVEYISQFVELEQRGDEWWGLSPFKDEKTPSFSVRPNPPFWYCYSTGQGGNLYSFIKTYFHCSGYETVKKLQAYAGVDDKTMLQRQKLDATQVFKRFTAPSKTVKTRTGVILPEDTMLRYEKRADKLDTWLREGISAASLDKFQVYYDAFSDRLVYPIRNQSGQIVNIGGRTLDPDWKEKKLRKYTYFYNWSTMDIIYGLWENLGPIKEQKEIILFEGAKSVMIADSWGISNCGALLTSHLNPSQMKLLAKLGVRAVFALDKEVDVRKDKNIRKLSNYIHVETICDRENLLDEKDSPVDKGEGVFRTLYESRVKL
jgi:DNA primase